MDTKLILWNYGIGWHIQKEMKIPPLPKVGLLVQIGGEINKALLLLFR